MSEEKEETILEEILGNQRELMYNVENINENICSVIDILKGIDFALIERLNNELIEREEKLQNVYDKLNNMINEMKGFVSIQRAEFKENCAVIRKFHTGLRAMFEDR